MRILKIEMIPSENHSEGNRIGFDTIVLYRHGSFRVSFEYIDIVESNECFIRHFLVFNHIRNNCQLSLHFFHVQIRYVIRFMFLY
jgi:hypothetical protein